MLPEEYQIDEEAAQRLEQETGAPLPEGAIQSLYEFEKEHPEFAQAIRRRGDASPDFTWSRAMLFADLGPLKYTEYWRDEIAREMRTLEEMLGIPPATEYHIDGFHARNIGQQPVDHDGEWSIKNCWRLTDDGADQHTMDIFLDDDDDVEKALRQMIKWTREIQGGNWDHLL